MNSMFMHQRGYGKCFNNIKFTGRNSIFKVSKKVLTENGDVNHNLSIFTYWNTNYHIVQYDINQVTLK